MFDVVSKMLEVKILALVLTLNVLVTTRKRVTKKKSFFIILKWVAPVVCLIICYHAIFVKHINIVIKSTSFGDAIPSEVWIAL